MASTIGTGHTPQTGTRSHVGKLLLATQVTLIDKAAAVLRPTSIFPSIPALENHSLRASASDPNQRGGVPGEGRPLPLEKVFGEPDAAFESFFSSAVQRRRLCWWKNIVAQKELIY